MYPENLRMKQRLTIESKKSRIQYSFCLCSLSVFSIYNSCFDFSLRSTWSRKDIHTFEASVAFPTSHLDPTFDPKKAIEISPELYTPLAQLTHSLTFLA